MKQMRQKQKWEKGDEIKNNKKCIFLPNKRCVFDMSVTLTFINDYVGQWGSVLITRVSILFNESAGI